MMWLYLGVLQVRGAKWDLQPDLFWGTPLQRYKDPKSFKVTCPYYVLMSQFIENSTPLNNMLVIPKGAEGYRP